MRRRVQRAAERLVANPWTFVAVVVILGDTPLGAFGIFTM